jgi:hypothetical protein
MMVALPTYCCTHRVDAGIRLPLSEGEVDFIWQVPNLINYPLLTLHNQLLIGEGLSYQ